MRLDLYLFNSGLCQSRTEAKSFITDGATKVNGKIVRKPSLEVDENDTVELDRSSKKYVSRGGLKLEAALDEFGIVVNDRIAIDVGASSGGFTDCLLQRGAKCVIAVDSGSGQLADKLRCDKRVTCIENYNARYMSGDDFSVKPTLAVMDVSFISATHIIPSLYTVLENGSDYILLIKPQFEVGPSGIGKGGIVRDDKKRKLAVDNVIATAKACGFVYVGLIESPIKGGDGNIEFLAYFRKE